jgi:8-oxo-dGTP pyrophosphatase MutT (NUDIX family)
MRIRHSAVPASYLILRRGEDILLQLRQNTGYYDGWWGVPSGHVEPGELPLACLHRETSEELGIRLDPQRVVTAHTMYCAASDATGERVDFFFVADRWEGEPTIAEPEKCAELRWFPLRRLPDKFIPHIRAAIEAIEHGETYSERTLAQITPNPTQ